MHFARLLILEYSMTPVSAQPSTCGLSTRIFLAMAPWSIPLLFTSHRTTRGFRCTLKRGVRGIMSGLLRWRILLSCAAVMPLAV